MQSMLSFLEQDTRAVRDNLLEDHNDYLGEKPHFLDKARYLSPDVHALEVERLWTKVWQMACREEEIPNVGDHLIYEVVDKQIIVVRSASDEIRAFFNACPHRARMICNTSGNVTHFRCPFHGLAWQLDGSVKHVPFPWDFPGVTDEDWTMFSVKIARWQGFVMINMDPDAMSFDDYIAGLRKHVDAWDFENRYIALHIKQMVRANWKLNIEATLEDYHIMATHPQALPFIPWGSSQYMANKDTPHWSRLLFGMGVPSFMAQEGANDQKTLDALKAQYGALPGEEAAWVVPSGGSARTQLAEINRKRNSKMANGKDFSQAADTEMIDNWVYPVFPNTYIWGGSSNYFYRYLPWKDDPEMSTMEIYFLLPLPEGMPRPAPAKMVLHGPDQKFSDMPELAGPVGEFWDQDLTNIEWVQRGLKTLPKDGVRLANYNESQIRHFHRTYDMYMSGNPPKAK
jgi:phenylpropionate dioxygenase-like ring-hydroxylating dioxygenase large terminal subunit